MALLVTREHRVIAAQELRERLAGTKSAPPGVDALTTTANKGQTTGVHEAQRAKTAAARFTDFTAVPVVKGSQLLQLAAMDSILEGMTVPVIYGEGGQVGLFDIVQGLITPFANLSDPSYLSLRATTFLTPEGQLVVTDPMTAAEGAEKGLMAVEVRASPASAAPVSRAASGGGLRPDGSAGILRSGRPSPVPSPTRQVSFVPREGLASAPSPQESVLSPRMSRLRRSRTAEGMASDLPVVMETTLPLAQESALDSMRKMLMEENLLPRQQQTLDSVRSAMSKIRGDKSLGKGEKREYSRGAGDGTSRGLTSEEMLRTMTVFTLASQLSHEALKLGVRPDSIFRNFGRLDTDTLSHIAPRASRKGRLEGASRDTTAADLLPSQTSDLESVDGVAEEATKQTVAVEELLDLPPIDGSVPDTSVSPSIQPPPTAATIGSMPAHDQLETPLAEIADQNASDYAKGDKEGGEGSGELKEDFSNLEKGHTDVTEERQGTQVTDGTGKEATQVEEGSELQSTGDNTHASKSAQPPSKTPDAIFKMEGDTEEDLRDASARSRASLRSHYKNRLGESRQAAEDRRSNTPQISLPSKMSVDEELVLDDDDDFDEMALPDNLKDELDEEKRKDVSMYEMGTSPPPGSGREPSSHSVRFLAGKASSLREHPILKQYLKNYHGVASFKDTLSKLFLDKDMMSASQILADLESLAFDPDKKVMPQVELLTANALYILEEIASVIQNAVMVDREPPVSSLLPFSRDETRNRRLPTREASEDIYPAYTHPKMVTPASGSVTEQVYVNSLKGSTSGSVVGGGEVSGVAGADETEPAVVVETTAAEMSGRASEDRFFDAPPSQAGSRAGSLQGSVQGSNKSSMSGSTKHYLMEMQSQCTTLQTQLEQESKKHEDQLRHNTVVMMEMQDTINELQRELSAIGKSSGKPRSTASSAAHVKAPSPDQSLMFTRLDLERNAKIMKKAVLDQRLDADTYKDVVTTMDDYVSLPAERLGHLVKKYVHHSRMKEIEDNVKKSQSLDEGVFDTLDKMEALQNQRARHWAEKMDTMGVERLRLAAMLMDSLDNIENQSGLFLIKPMYSFRGRELKAPPTQKLARPARPQPVPRYLSATHSATSFVPAPTPASNARRMDRHTPTQQYAVDLTALPPPPPSRPEDGVIGSGAIRNIVTPQAPQLTQSYQTWNMSVSHARSPLDSLQQNSLNTPRMLELDINRMLIGQNNVSTKLPQPPSDDRLQNATNNSLRSYVTVQRPTATFTADRATSNQGGRATGAPPSSPSPRPSPRPSAPVSPADRGLARTMTSPDPLPPIGDRPPSAVFSDLEDPEPPRSPPGSSMYQSTTHDPDDNTKTVNTRPSSQLSD